MKKSELEAKVREQEIEIAGLKAKLELLEKMYAAVPQLAPVILPPVIAPSPLLPVVQPWKENWPQTLPYSPFDAYPKIICGEHPSTVTVS